MKMIRIRKFFLGFIMTTFLGLSAAQSENLFGEFKRLPDEIERGFTLGFDFGLLFITNQSTTTASNPGFQLAFALGYDIFDYLSLEQVTTLGISEANPVDPVLDGGVNTFIFGLLAKGQYPLGRLYPFVEAGPGLVYTKPSFGKNKKMAITLAGGLEYYTFLRHYSFIAKFTYHHLDLPIHALTLSVGLKYTF